MATNRCSVTSFDGLMVMNANKGAKCSCGKCGEKLRKGDVGYRFTVFGTSKWFTKECYEGKKFVAVDNTSGYDAKETINHTMEIVFDKFEDATIKMLQGFSISFGKGKNLGKFYCRLYDNEACYSTGHYAEASDDVRVNGKKVKGLKGFREATH